MAEEARRAIGAASLSVSRWDRERDALVTLINVGELGPGFSADLALHMGQADALREVGSSASVTVPGYPIGPHTLVAAVGEGLGLDTRSVFLGLLLAIPVLTGLTALAGFDDLSPGRRLLGAALVGLPYLPASYFVGASFKELVLAAADVVDDRARAIGAANTLTFTKGTGFAELDQIQVFQP